VIQFTVTFFTGFHYVTQITLTPLSVPYIRISSDVLLLLQQALLNFSFKW